eukprot:2852746-Rhodomonas_salina.2
MGESEGSEGSRKTAERREGVWKVGTEIGAEAEPEGAIVAGEGRRELERKLVEVGRVEGANLEEGIELVSRKDGAELRQATLFQPAQDLAGSERLSLKGGLASRGQACEGRRERSVQFNVVGSA